MTLSKNRVNWWLDVVMFVDIVLISLIGLVMEYLLPPGTGGWHRGQAKTFLFMSRHEWGYVHFILGLILLAILVIHIILHWNWIVHQYRCTFGKKRSNGDSCDESVE